MLTVLHNLGLCFRFQHTLLQLESKVRESFFLGMDA